MAAKRKTICLLQALLLLAVSRCVGGSFSTVERRLAADSLQYEPARTSKTRSLSETAISHANLGLGIGGAAMGLFSGAVGVAGIIISQQTAQAAAERHEELMKMREKELCQATCVTGWSHWSPCSRLCGGGTTSRTRKLTKIENCAKFSCPYKDQLDQTTHCNTGCPHGGTPNPNIKGCSCKNGWEGPCCDEETICDYPGKPKNGYIQGTQPFKFRSIVSFTCKPGYALVAQDEKTGDWQVEEDVEHLCTAEGIWKGRKIKCQKIFCSKPEYQKHLQILNPKPEYTYDEIVVYMCDEGYVMRGPEQQTCKSRGYKYGNWTGFTPICLSVKCDDPGIPINGNRSGEELTYGKVVSFNCDKGYKLIGSHSMKCMASGKWLGHFPTCTQIQFESPLVPEHVRVFMRSSKFGSLISFVCDEGYVLQGERTLKCGLDGMWNGKEPTCIAAHCGDPGVPENGAKDGALFYYPHSVTYQCFNGYQLKGVKNITCQENGEWNFVAPTCEACEVNTYMDDIKHPGTCIPCPPNTHTASLGSFSRRHCICNKGYFGPEGGPCQEVRCEDLSAPEHGSLLEECDNRANQTCFFGCDDGFIFNKGTSMRTCQENGEWDGHQPTCSPCPRNTYKSGDRSCLPCPRNSQTVGVANMKKGCICNKGYEGEDGGPCKDVNECEVAKPCKDICENTDGSYTCRCLSVPGYKVNPKDGHTCIVEHQCQNLTDEDAPAHGGLVCHWHHAHNSQQCKAICNPGYEFPSRTNNYESCGPTTKYIWTHKTFDPEATFDGCIKQFYGEIRLEGEGNYFLASCNNLTVNQKLVVMEHFANVLNEHGVCFNDVYKTKACQIKDMGIICGKTQRRRRRRGVDIIEHSLDVLFNITTYKFNKASCPEICDKFGIEEKQCPRLCGHVYHRFLKATMKHTKRFLDNLTSNYNVMRELELHLSSILLVPEEIKTSPLMNTCLDPGMELKDDLCIPCRQGTYLSSVSKMCEPCSRGFYQFLSKEKSCVQCPEGSTTYEEGAKGCKICQNGTYGVNCSGVCLPCINGMCHPVTGECVCSSGWEGPLCDKDIDACLTVNCFPGVQCRDNPAPEVGFTCDPCLPGYHGDGADCVPIGIDLPDVVLLRKR